MKGVTMMCPERKNRRDHEWRIKGFDRGPLGDIVFIECKRCYQSFTAECVQ